MITEYKQASELVFNDIKNVCIKYWKNNFSDEYGYVTEKLSRIEQIKNEGADVMFILNMFHHNIRKEIFYDLNKFSQDYIKYYNKTNGDDIEF